MRNPSKKLLAFWSAKYKVDGLERKELKFEVEKTLEVCEVLRMAPDLIGQGYIGGFVREWMKKWKE